MNGPIFDLAKNIIGWAKNDVCIKEIPAVIARDVIKKNHYSKSFVPNSCFHLGVFRGGKFGGVLQVGPPINKGKTKTLFKSPLPSPESFIELNRMWLSDEMPPFSESQSISLLCKYLKLKYRQRGIPLVALQSFADERCNKKGAVYQACSFVFLGSKRSSFVEYEGRVFHHLCYTRSGLLNRVKNCKKLVFMQYRYMRFFDKKWQNDCLLNALPYPKG